MPKREPKWMRDARKNGLSITTTEIGMTSIPADDSRKLPYVIVPVPPSTNNLFPTSKNRKTGKAVRYKSKEYTAWLKVALPIIKNLKSPEKYPCEIMIRCGTELNSRSDIANREKAITDACVTAKVIDGDSVKYITDVVLRYRPDDAIDGVRVEFRNPSED